MQGGCSIRGSNSSGARFSRYCGGAFMAVAPKKRRRHALFCFSAAHVVSEGLDLEAAASENFREAPVFHGLYLGIIVIGALVTMIPHAPLLSILYYSQVVNRVLLPIFLIFTRYHQRQKRNGRARQFSDLQLYYTSNSHLRDRIKRRPHSGNVPTNDVEIADPPAVALLADVTKTIFFVALS